MNIKSRMDLVLQLTHWFNGHWEDPSWGRDHMVQTILGIVIKELSAGIVDTEAQKQVAGAADKVIAAGLRAN
ncbi:MAG: hypothetical protein JSS21_11810 [Proteobacteria bacterium]|nr:hypothetical protein [Pseudomonadota bacterium]